MVLDGYQTHNFLKTHCTQLDVSNLSVIAIYFFELIPLNKMF